MPGGVATHGEWSVSEAAQAAYLLHFLQGVEQLRAKGIHVGVNILYMVQDSSEYNGTSGQPFFGALRHDGTEKPAGL